MAGIMRVLLAALPFLLLTFFFFFFFYDPLAAHARSANVVDQGRMYFSHTFRAVIRKPVKKIRLEPALRRVTVAGVCGDPFEVPLCARVVQS